jgi:hypothetical protein
MTRFYYCTWTDEDDRKLSEIMNKGFSERKKTLALFNEAASALGRTAKSCQNRWYEIKAREAV